MKALGLRLGVIAIAAFAASVAGAEPRTAAAVLESLGFEDGALADARAGRVVSRAIQESGRNEVGAAVAMIVDVPPERVRDRVRAVGLSELDPSVMAHGSIGKPATAASFAGLRIPPAELDRLARAAPGGDLNLATEEIAALADAAPNGPEAVGDRFRELLAKRVEAYRARGLAGIAPYARASNASTSPGDALRAALEASTVLHRFAPAAHEALSRYPQALPAGFEERFSWALVDVQDRPAVVLVHRLVGPVDGGTLVAERQFYASQGFDALQVVIGVLPIEGDGQPGSAVIYSNRTSSAQAARFGRMAQSIGRRMLVAEVTRFFEAIRKTIGG